MINNITTTINAQKYTLKQHILCKLIVIKKIIININTFLFKKKKKK